MDITILNVNPVPKPRMTRRDKWQQRDCVVRYREFADNLRGEAKDKYFELAGAYQITFFVRMPDSWSKKKKIEMQGRYHQQKPDLDNFIKAFQDALSKDDSFVYKIVAEKVWDYDGYISVMNI